MPPAPDAGQRRQRLGALALAGLAHGLAWAGLLSLGRMPSPSAPPRVLQVAWLAPPQETPPPLQAPPPPQRAPRPPAPTPPQRPSPHQPAPAPTLIAAAPAPSVPAPEPVADTPAPHSTPPAGDTATAPREAPAPVTPARFDADYLDNPAPDYPAASRRLAEQGQVTLRVQVTPDGHAGEVRLHRSSGFERLDQAALEAVRQWRFIPARQGDKTVAAWVIVPIHFTLRRS